MHVAQLAVDVLQDLGVGLVLGGVAAEGALEGGGGEQQQRSATEAEDRHAPPALPHLDLVQHGRIRTPVLAEVDEVGRCPVVVDQQHLWREAPQQ